MKSSRVSDTFKTFNNKNSEKREHLCLKHQEEETISMQCNNTMEVMFIQKIWKAVVMNLSASYNRKKN